jgi:hypothetical protein
MQIVGLGRPLEDIHVEVALQDGSIRLEHLARTVLATTTPITLVNGTIRPIHLSITISLIVLVVTLVHIAGFPREDSIAMFFVKVVFAFI